MAFPKHDFKEEIMKDSLFNSNVSNKDKINKGSKSEQENMDVIGRANLIVNSSNESQSSSYKEIVIEQAKRRSQNTVKSTNNVLLSNALEVSRKFKEREELNEKKKGLITTILTSLIKPFTRKKPVLEYIEFHADMSAQIIELDKRFRNAIEETSENVFSMIDIKDRFIKASEGLGIEIDELKSLIDEVSFEILSLEQIIDNNPDVENSEILTAKARVEMLKHTLTRLDNRHLNRQSEYTNINLHIQTAEEEIDTFLDQKETLKTTQNSLVHLLDSASIAAMGNETLERAIFNSRTQTGINETMVSFYEKRASNAEAIARQNERPIYAIGALKRISELQQKTNDIKADISEKATKQRQEIREQLSIVLSNSIKNTSLSNKKSEIMSRVSSEKSHENILKILDEKEKKNNEQKNNMDNKVKKIKTRAKPRVKTKSNTNTKTKRNTK